MLNERKLIETLNQDYNEKNQVIEYEIEDWCYTHTSCREPKEIYYLSDDEESPYVERYDIELSQFHTKSKNPEHIYDVCFVQYASGKQEFGYGYSAFDEFIRRVNQEKKTNENNPD